MYFSYLKTATVMSVSWNSSLTRHSWQTWYKEFWHIWGTDF